MNFTRLFSAFSISMVFVIAAMIGVRLFLLNNTPNSVKNLGQQNKPSIQLGNQITKPSQILITPTYQDDMGAGILLRSPFSPSRAKFMRVVEPPRPQAQVRRPTRTSQPPRPKTGRLLGILGRGETRRAIIAIDGEAAPLEVKLDEPSPLGKLIRFERSKIILIKGDKEIELSMF